MAISNPFIALKSRYFVFGTFMGSSVAIGSLYSLLSLTPLLPWPYHDPISTPILFIVIFCLICSTIFWGCWRFHLNLKHLFGSLSGVSSKGLSGGYLLVLVVSILLFSFSSFALVFYPLSFIAPHYVEAQLSERLFAVDTVVPHLYQGLMVFVTLLFAPLAEEFIFRGILLQRWSVKWGLRTGILLSSLLFGSLHINNPIGLTMFGVIMALLYIRTHSLWTAILAHALNNLFSVLPDLLFSGKAASSHTLKEFQDIWWIGLIFTLLSVPILAHFIYHSWPSPGAKAPYFVNANATLSKDLSKGSSESRQQR